MSSATRRRLIGLLFAVVIAVGGWHLLESRRSSAAKQVSRTSGSSPAIAPTVPEVPAEISDRVEPEPLAATAEPLKPADDLPPPRNSAPRVFRHGSLDAIGRYRPNQEAPSDPTLKNAGFATPKAALESMLWAIDRGDVEVLAQHIVFDARSRAAADQLFADLPPDYREQFDTPEGMIAALLVAESEPITAWSTIGGDPDSQVRESDGSVWFAAKYVTADGVVNRRVMNFKPTATGWSRFVNAAQIRHWRAMVLKR